MKTLKIALICLTVLGLQACKTKPPAPVKSLRSVQSMSIPEVGATVTAGIGEALLVQGDAHSVQYIQIPNDQTIGAVTIRQGTYPRIAHTSELDTFRVSFAKGEGDKLNKPGTLHIFDKDKGSKTACVSRTDCGPIEYSIDQTTNFEKAQFQQTLLYSGKIGNRITLGYREFSNNSARPAFNNDVAYDLSESTVLGYKGARIEVLKATNTEITYKLVSGFH